MLVKFRLTRTLGEASHHLVLSHAASAFLTFHRVSAVGVGVFDKGQAQWTAPVHVASKFG